MVRTQVQLPDELYAQAKRIAERHEMSLAELVRRGLEHMLRVYPLDEKEKEAWRLPEPVAMGELLAPVENWRELANVGELRE